MSADWVLSQKSKSSFSLKPPDLNELFLFEGVRMTRPSGVRSKATAGTPKERKMALKHRTNTALCNLKHNVHY